MNNKKSMLKCILASAVAVSSLGTLASAQDMSAPCINEDVSKKLSSPFEQTPFLVKAKSIAKGTRVVLAKKKSTPTGAAATITEDDIPTTTTTRSEFTSGNASVANKKYSVKNQAKYGAAVYSSTNINIEDSIFKNSSTSSNGGALYIERKNSNISASIDNVIFSNNTSRRGGAVYLKGASSSDSIILTINDATFVGNSATEANAGYGGAIYASYSTLEINNTDFNQNTSTASGGAIHSQNNSSVNIKDSSFSGNTATSNGGALHLFSNSTSSITAEGSNVEFRNNDARYGGAISQDSRYSTLNLNTSNGKKIIFYAPDDDSNNDIYNLGTININGDVKVETNISGNGTLNLNSGTFYAKQLSQGRLNLNGGTLSFQESDAKTQNLPVAYSSSSVTTLSGSGNLKIDVNLIRFLLIVPTPVLR